jgi:hypothetical protein
MDRSGEAGEIANFTQKLYVHVRDRWNGRWSQPPRYDPTSVVKLDGFWRPTSTADVELHV